MNLWGFRAESQRATGCTQPSNMTSATQIYTEVLLKVSKLDKKTSLFCSRDFLVSEGIKEPAFELEDVREPGEVGQEGDPGLETARKHRGDVRLRTVKSRPERHAKESSIRA